MKKYLVGGAVRDMFLGKEPHDKDYVIIGSSIEEMILLGYKQVGKDFPVFLDKYGNEHTLARTERKSGVKHTDFEFDFNPNITLEQDLFRRDFTINSIAYDEDTHKFTDPYGGIYDILTKTLRVTNPKAFKDDPLRLLRLFRFKVQLDFSIEQSTLQLAKEMINEGCLKNLTSERIFNEIEKAANTTRFADFIHILHEMGALEYILPEIETLYSVPENPEYHKEKNAGEHTENVLRVLKSDNAKVNLAALFHDVGKSVTPKEDYPHHKGHDILGADLMKDISKRLNIPNEYKNLCLYICKYHDKFRYIKEMRLTTLYDFAKELSNNFKDLYNLNYLSQIVIADGSVKNYNFDMIAHKKSREIIFNIFHILQNTHVKDFPELKDLSGEQLGKRYRGLCIEKIRKEIKR